MTSRIWLIGAALIVLSTGYVFANGAVGDDDCGYYGRNGMQGMHGNFDNRGMMGDWQDMDTETVEGTFAMVDGEYPAIVTEDGETLYLMMRFPVDGDQMPRDGADLKLEALQSPMSPVHLVVLSAEVDGVEIDWDWDDHGRGGHMYDDQDMYGGRGAKPGWGYSDQQAN